MEENEKEIVFNEKPIDEKLDNEDGKIKYRKNKDGKYKIQNIYKEIR